MRFLITAIYLFFSAPSFADLQEDYELLKDSGTNFQVIGVICEQVARLELYETYSPDKYDIETGIAYGDRKRTIGELDVIVFDRASKKAVVVGEVKCWKDLAGAHRKAMKQRERFMNQINSDARLEFRSTTTGQVYRQEQFEGIKEYISISQKGGEAAGFTHDLDYSLEELMDLRRQIISCQKAHKCAAPRHLF